MADIVVSTIAKIVGDYIGGVMGSAAAGAAVSMVIAEAEYINLSNNLSEGKATPADVIALTTAIEGAILGTGIVLTEAGLLATGIGASIPLTAVALAAAAAWVFFNRNNTAAQDAFDTFINGVKNGDQPWTFIPKIIDSFNENAYHRNIVPTSNTTYLTSRTLKKTDPLTLDLDNDGLETIGINPSAPILFDHNGDGIKTGTGWIKSDDGFLAYDRDGNNSIDSGQELFGDSTALYAGGTAADGFAALAQEDSNGDGLVNASDAHWAALKIWRDLNQDGISQSNELFSLDSQNIAALQVAKTANSQTLANGNQIADLGGYLKTDGNAGTLGTVSGMGDVNLASNPFYSQFTDHIPLTAAAKNIASMQGAGKVRNLQEAASLDGNLATQVNNLSTSLTRAQMISQIDGLIDNWAATSGMKTSIESAYDKGYRLDYLPPGMSASDLRWLHGLYSAGGGSSTGTLITEAELGRREALRAQKAHIDKLMGVLERFNGTPYVTVGDAGVTTGTGTQIDKFTTISTGISTGTSGAMLDVSPYVFVPISVGSLSLLEKSYAQLKESVYDGLVLQTRLKPYLDSVTLSIDQNGIRFDYSALDAVNDADWRRVA